VIKYKMRLFLLSFILFSCSNNPELVKEFIELEDLPIEQIKGAEMLHTEEGVLKLRIVAANIKRFKDTQPHLIFSDGLEVAFYDDSGSVKSVLTAFHAEINDLTKIMTASNNVVLKSEEGNKLESEELIWDEKKNKIFTDKRVVITTEKEVIEGEGFQSNPDFSEYSVTRIQGTFEFDNLTK
tara:strand:+ start:1560 stop:2105 length:546 start_codon:yes stop_codon:yes gene_type:complete